MKQQAKPHFFKNELAFRKWLIKNHLTEKELYVGFYKIKTGKPSLTWSQSVDQALCFGWIDGVRKSIDEESYQIRFTPRLKNSIWSTININKINQLIKEDKMYPKGLELFNNRKPNASAKYTFEKEKMSLTVDLLKAFKENKKAWTFYQSLTPSYQKSTINWIMGAVKNETRVNRLHKMMQEFEKNNNPWKHTSLKN